MKKVLSVCTHNAGRSQMAQALFHRYAPSNVRAESAGAQPDPTGDPIAEVRVIRDEFERQLLHLLEHCLLEIRSYVLVLAERETHNCIAGEVCHALTAVG